MLAPVTTKADEQAVERMFQRAVEAAITDLRTAPSYAEAYERNVDRFHVAIRASELFTPKGEPCTTTPD